MALDRDDLDDTYDLLSPVRRSNSYSNRFESSETEDGTSEALNSSSAEVTYSPLGSPRSPSFPPSSKFHPPKYTSTSRYHGGNLPPRLPAQSKTRKKPVVRHTSPTKARTSHDTTKDLMRIPQEGDKTELSVWEDWLIRKVQEEREKMRLKKMSDKQAQLEQERLEKEKEEKKKQEEINRQQWCEQKALKEKLQRAMKRREELLKQELEAQEQRQIKRKAKEAYGRWLLKQEELESEHKRKVEEEKQRALVEQEERKRRNEECFQEWLKKANERKPSTPRSKPKSAPIGYPAPTYRNPAPWIGPLCDADTRESVRRQHRMMIAEKHETIRKNRGRPTTAPRQRGLVKTGPGRGKGVLICRPATATPIFHSIPARNNRKFAPDAGRPTRGRS